MQVPILNTVRCTAHLTRGSEQLVNVWHVLYPGGPPSSADMAAIRLAFQTFYGGPIGAAVGIRGIRDWIDASVNIERFTTQWIDEAPFADPEETMFNLPGTHAGDALPLQTALCLSFRTGVATRRARGRVYLGGFGIDANDENAPEFARPSAAFLLDVQQAMDDLTNAIDDIGPGSNLAVASQLDGVARSITSVRIKNVWSTQRRRAESVPVTSTLLVTP